VFAMNISMLAKATQTSARAIRHYEATGLLRSRRAANGYRVYGEDAVVAVSHIRWLISAGLTTKTIREILPCIVKKKPKVAVCDRTRFILKREHDRIDAQLKKLRRSQKLLKAALGPLAN
jgi:DNA-binding transcriptional MerR regulator